MKFLRMATVIGLSFACIRFAASQSTKPSRKSRQRFQRAAERKVQQ